MKRKILTLSILTIICVGIMGLLYATTEELIAERNPFIRRFPPHPAYLRGKAELGYNSYYFAGYDKGRIYLGNYSARLRLWSIDEKLHNFREHKITFKNKDDWKRPVYKIANRHFYLLDGNIPKVISGQTNSWDAFPTKGEVPYFTVAEITGNNRFSIRSTSAKDGSNILGSFMSEHDSIVFFPELLTRQDNGDGIFDTEGSLLYSEEIGKIIYVYRYRNQYLIADLKGKPESIGHTIDTVSKAGIKVARLKDGTERKMAVPPLIVNAHAAVCKHLLFVHSTLKGKYDNEQDWKNAATIDVYDLNNHTYLMSFYIDNIGEKKLTSLLVTPQFIYALIDTKVVAYQVDNLLASEFNRYQ